MDASAQSGGLDGAMEEAGSTLPDDGGGPDRATGGPSPGSGPGPGSGSGRGGDPAPVGYSVAVEKYLDAASLSVGSRRVYRIALNTWAWLLVERTPPRGRERRGVVEPIVPLAVLDGADAAGRLGSAVRKRADEVDARTLERELSTLRGAVSWWHRRGWLGTDLAGSLRPDAVAPRFPAVRLTRAQVRSVFGLRAGLREQTLWHMVYDGGGQISGQICQILELDVGDLDETRTGTHATSAYAVRVRARTRAGDGAGTGAGAGASGAAGRNRRGPAGSGDHSASGSDDASEALRWRAETAELVRMLVVGRAAGPVFLTDRRAGPDVPARDRCPVTGRGRLSYRRAAEIFTNATRLLDPAGRGWTLGQLRASGPAVQGNSAAGERVSSRS
jgi:integrase/recombinase XerD